MKAAVFPAVTDTLAGWVVMVGPAAVTVSVAGLEITVWPLLPVTTHRN